MANGPPQNAEVSFGHSRGNVRVREITLAVDPAFVHVSCGSRPDLRQRVSTAHECAHPVYAYASIGYGQCSASRLDIMGRPAWRAWQSAGNATLRGRALSARDRHLPAPLLLFTPELNTGRADPAHSHHGSVMPWAQEKGNHTAVRQSGEALPRGRRPSRKTKGSAPFQPPNQPTMRRGSMRRRPTHSPSEPAADRADEAEASHGHERAHSTPRWPAAQ